MAVKFKIEGTDQVFRNIDKETKEQSERADKLTEAIARQVSIDAKRNTPVQTHRLRDSIRIYNKSNDELGAGLQSHEYAVGTNVLYAYKVHKLPRTRTGTPRYLWNAVLKNQSNFINGLKHIFK